MKNRLVAAVCLAATFFLLSSGFAFSQELKKSDRLAGISPYIEKKMEEWKIPGMAIGIIQSDSVVLLKGFGFRDIDKKLPVTPRTLFGIASMSKTLTAAAVGILCDEGKLRWNTPIIEYVPDFRLYDDYATFNATIRDLLSHRTGLSSFSDFMVYVWPQERDEIYRRLRYLEPGQSFRHMYQYSNISFVTAGAIVGKLSGSPWEDFVNDRIFKPLRMDNSNFGLQIQNVDDFSYPYGYEHGQYVKLPFRDRPAGNPSGGINSSAGDMVNWLKLHLNKGKINNQQIISPTSLDIIKNPLVFSFYSEEEQWPPMISSAMGWDFQFYSGYHLLAKGGVIDGYSGFISFMPQEKIGIAILANNREAYDLSRFLSYRIYDQLLDFKEFRWEKIIEGEKPKYREASDRSSKEPQAKSEKMSYLLEKYAGSYEHAAYGKATVYVENGEFRLNFNKSLVWPLEHCFYSVFKSEFSGAPVRIEFKQDIAGNVTSLEIQFEGTDFNIIFKKIADR